MATPSSDRTEQLAAIEEWFVARGIPHFIRDYNAAEDVFTRALPALILVILFESLIALDLEWGLVVNVLAAGGGLAVLLGIWALANVVRGRRPLARPDDVGAAELALFVVAPALLPLIFGGHEGQALLTAGINVVLLGAVYVITSYGLVPLTRWAAARAVAQLHALFGLVSRALPLLLLFITFLFINTEVWQVAGVLSAPFLALVVGLFFAVGTTFLVSRIPGEVAGLTVYESAAVLDVIVEETPAGVLIEADSALPASPPLSRREWGNVGLVVLFSQGVQVLLVSLAIGTFFIILGLTAISESTLESWLGAGNVHELASVHLWGRDVLLSEELLRVSAFLAGFTGLYFTVYLITDETYRREFFTDIVGELRESLAVRAVYRAALPD